MIISWFGRLLHYVRYDNGVWNLYTYHRGTMIHKVYGINDRSIYEREVRFGMI